MNNRFGRSYDQQEHALPRSAEERRRWNERNSRSYRDSARDEARERNFAGARGNPSERERHDFGGYDEPREWYEHGGSYRQAGHYGQHPHDPAHRSHDRDYGSDWTHDEYREKQASLPPDNTSYGRSWEHRAREQEWDGERGQRSFAVDWGPNRVPWQARGERRSFSTSNASESFSDEGRRSNRGTFAGKGPKGYTRSDERIREEVCDRLSDDDEVDASDITVTVKDGEIRLDGTVPDRRTKHRAEDIADSVGGVKDVHNALKTQKSFLQEVGDRIVGRDEPQHGHSGSGTRDSSAH